jgi:hypothetical protein
MAMWQWHLAMWYPYMMTYEPHNQIAEGKQGVA